MVQNTAINPYYIPKTGYNQSGAVPAAPNPITAQNGTSLAAMPAYNTIGINTTLTQSDKEKYSYLVDFVKDMKPSENSEGLSPQKQLDFLLKNGKLLKKSANDASSVLDNLYNMAVNERCANLSAKNLISNTLDILINPRYVTQNFGDIPPDVKSQIVNALPQGDDVKNNPALMDVDASGTCAAGSLEVNIADKYPADYARIIEGLSSKEQAVYFDIPLKSISKNKLDAITILNLLKAEKTEFNFEKTKVKITADPNAIIRAQIQDKFWDKGERNVANALFQSAVMQSGSQKTYNSLTDIRAGEFNSNPQGLTELEKTFVESIFKNKEITSLVYQKIDENQNLLGYTCSFDKIQKHIIDTLNSGDDVIMGYILTNETSGRTLEEDYNPELEGAPNKVINGHEITIVDYTQDENGNVNFICIDTDDDSPDYVEYPASWLVPKIHHAGYPAKIVEADEKAIMSQII